MKNADLMSYLTDTPVGGIDRDYHLDESGTLEHLLDVCQDAALGARLAAEAVAADQDLAEFLREIAKEQDEFATHLAIRLARTARDPNFATKGTFRGKLYHWRLRFARSLAGHVDDAEALDMARRIVRHGSDGVLRAYEEAEGRPLSTDSRREVHRQAERIRESNIRIHRLTR